MKNISLKTIAGVGAGVAIGHFAFKAKNPLVLMAFGVGGGILSYHLLKEKGAKISEAEVTDYIVETNKDIEATLVVDEPKLQPETIKFNPTVGYPTPQGEVHENSGSEFMDIGF